MSEFTYEGTTGKPHHILGLILGIIGVIIALVLAIWTGLIGGGIALLLGVIALILGIKARKHHKGIGAIIVGGLAIILAIVMTFSSIGLVNTLHEKALETDRAPLLARYSANPYLGLMGVAINVAKDGSGTVEQLNEEVSLLNAK